MKRLILMLSLLAAAIPCTAGTIPLTGTIRTSDGNLLNGSIQLLLNYSAARDSCSGNIVVAQMVTFRVSNGTLPSGARITPNDCLQPTNTTYTARYYSSSGQAIAQNVFAIQGASFNLGDAIPTPLTTSNISFGDLTGLVDVSSKEINNVQMCDVASGANIGAKINACIGALPSTGGIADGLGILGTQTISTAITCSKPVDILLGATTLTATSSFNLSNGCRIVGGGKGTTVISYSGTNTAAVNVSGDNAGVFGVKFILDATPAAAISAVKFSSSSAGFTARDLSVVGTGTISSTNGCNFIEFGDSSNVTRVRVSDSYFENLDYVMIEFNSNTGANNDIVFDRITVNGTAAGINPNHPGATGSTSNVTVTNSRFYGGATEWYIGCSGAAAEHTGGVRNCKIANNTFENSAQEAIHLEDWTYGPTISNNIFTNCSNATDHGCIQIISGVRHVSVTGNLFDMSVNSGGTASAVYGQPSTGAAPDDIVVEGNRCLVKTGVFCFTFGSSTGVTVRGNYLSNVDSASKAAQFLTFVGAKGTCQGNTFYNPGTLVRIDDNSFMGCDDSFFDGELTGFDWITGNNDSSTAVAFRNFTLNRAFTAAGAATFRDLFPAGLFSSGNLGFRFQQSGISNTFTATADVWWDLTGSTSTTILNQKAACISACLSTLRVNGGNWQASATGTGAGIMVITFTGELRPTT